MTVKSKAICTFGLAVIAAVAVSGCTSKSSQREDAKLQKEIAALSARVDSLQSQPEEQKSADTGSWILWQRDRTLWSKYAIASPAPAEPTDAFSSKRACKQAGQRLAGLHGGKPGSSAYVERSKDFIDRVFYSCLPRGVPVKY